MYTLLTARLIKHVFAVFTYLNELTWHANQVQLPIVIKLSKTGS